MDVFFVCLWFDHYLHQHGKCGPTGAMWLGGIATYTTTGDQCTKMVFSPSVHIVGCFHLVLRVFGVCFLVIYALSLDAWLSLLYDVRFDAFPY